MKEFWDERYRTDEYAYGIEPNEFFRQEIIKLNSGKILFSAEGEGRNAVFAAGLGWNVTAYDFSSEAKRKAEILAKENNLKINYHLSTHEEFLAEKESFDCIALIYVHLSPGKRTKIHQKLAGFLKPGGVLILEGFSKEQIHNNTGGPKNVDMLFSEEELRGDFSVLSFSELIKKEINFSEGKFHQGIASVIRLIGKK